MSVFFARHTNITDGSAALDTNDGLDTLGAALVNASYDHTGGGSGERQLTAASGTPFANSLAGDPVFLLNAVAALPMASISWRPCIAARSYRWWLTRA